MDSIQQNIPLLLMRTREIMMQSFRPILNRRNITEQQWRILRVVYEYKKLEPWQLCELCCIVSPSMAGILKRMENIGLIIKMPLSSDKRRVEVSLAPDVEILIEEILLENNKEYNKFSEKVGIDLLNTLEKTLEEVLKKANSNGLS